ncbi:hypothetical protein C488_14757 [Natrinema pellirubrum DSM 15624]|uniref:Uncharacterized protein n=1 Tax=Natrinema pellirubrum (strain DSM 15624 / CIP 106293 / JCM 10476 / NCIMB 786 / 157) TaxID=797303 RepID=L9YII7_NATP1|nr:hypothetical protein C488_14757 [Natrinema pellirubrum DSM 15624]
MSYFCWDIRDFVCVAEPFKRFFNYSFRSCLRPFDRLACTINISCGLPSCINTLTIVKVVADRLMRHEILLDTVYIHIVP